MGTETWGQFLSDLENEEKCSFSFKNVFFAK